MPDAEIGSLDPGLARTPTVAVVVCAYSERRWELLSDGIRAILAQTTTPDRVILVVDHNDGLLERARRQFGERIAVIPNASRQGLSGARNSGIGEATEAGGAGLGL